MSMRIATRSLLNNYSRNLGKAMGNLSDARTKVMTKRNFNTVSESPSSAVKSYQLRREYSRNNNYLENTESALDLFDAIDEETNQISTILRRINGETLRAINGATSYSTRQTYAKSLRESMETILMHSNVKFGDKFLLGGLETKEPPFTMNNGVLEYRGIDVNSNVQADIDKLNEYSQEKLYSDLGFGLKEDANGTVAEGTAFNTALPGINLLGYGTDSNGVSNNIITLIGQIADEIDKPNIDDDRMQLLTDKFLEIRDKVIDNLTQVGTKTKFLEDTKLRIEDTQYILNEQIVRVENVDMAEAITNYMWEQYAYNAALKVGTSILSPSFIDFMK